MELVKSVHKWALAPSPKGSFSVSLVAIPVISMLKGKSDLDHRPYELTALDEQRLFPLRISQE